MIQTQGESQWRSQDLRCTVRPIRPFASLLHAACTREPTACRKVLHGAASCWHERGAGEDTQQTSTYLQST